jgi:signal transduction histidine kinase
MHPNHPGDPDATPPSSGAHPPALVSPHVVHFYESDAALMDRLEGIIRDAFAGEGAGLVIATAAHRTTLDARLTAAGFDLGALRHSGAYVSVDAGELLSKFIVDGMPDADRFEQAVVPLLKLAGANGRRVRAFGEMVTLLVAEGHSDAALALEVLWNSLQSRFPFVLFCAYSLDLMAGTRDGRLIRDVCLTHGQVIPGESFLHLSDTESRDRLVVELQQRSRWLESEIAARELAEKELARALITAHEAREAAEEALRLREDFIAIAAHELKTPLTTALGNIQLVARRIAREGASTGVDRALAESIVGVKKLANLVGQLLDMSRFETGKLPLELEEADLVTFVYGVVGSAAGRYEMHPLNVSGRGTAMCRFDPLRLEQVFSNLIDNAMKYSAFGKPVEVRIDVIEDDGRRVAQVSVRDHGYGVAPEQREMIFDRFFQADSPVHKQGLGLGLYISREVVKQHGGRLFAEYPDDGGSRFVLELPLL